jgi:hypothetical protein
LDFEHELYTCIHRTKKISDACDKWLTDHDDPERYSIDPGAEEVKVQYKYYDGKKRVHKTRSLSEFISLIEKNSENVVEKIQVKHADPQKLLLEATRILTDQLERLSNHFGIFTRMMDQDWLDALRNVVREIQLDLSQRMGRQLSWSETIDEILKYNDNPSRVVYLNKLKAEGEKDKIVTPYKGGH